MREENQDSQSHGIPGFQEFLHRAYNRTQDNTDDLDNVMKPDVSSPYHAETLPVVKLLSPKPSNKKLKKRQKSKKSLLDRSHSRKACKACDDLHKMGIKGSNPMQSEKQE